MPVPAVCPQCRNQFALPDQLRGQKVRCARCQSIFVAAAPRPQVVRASPAPAAHAPPRARGGVSHMTMFLGMTVAFLLAVIVVGALAFVFILNRDPSGPVASVETKTSDKEPAPTPTTKAKDPTDDPRPKDPSVKDPPAKDTPVVVTGDGSLPPAILQRVKKATVYLRVTMADGSVSQGTGFFGVEPGVIISNAHVLGMVRALAPPPMKIEVILNSGQADERVFPGQLLEVDRNVDLAVLKVAGDSLPEPMTLLTAKDLIETQQVFVCGFPLGVKLGKEITIGNSRVASFRREGGVVTRVQLSGGMDPGNSGGPIIDTRGNVVAVAVAGVLNTTINFAIPGEHVHALLGGRVTKATFGQAYTDGNQIKVPATIQLLDPLKRVQKVAVDVWTGDAGDPRPPATTAPPPLPNDSPRVQTALTYANGVGRADIALPVLPANRVYWFQIVVGGAGESKWTQANSIATASAASPVERKSVTLPLGHKAGAQPLEVSSKLVLVTERGGSETTLAMAFQTFLQETVQVDGQGTATIRLQYQKMTTNVSVNGQSPPNNLQQVAPLLNLVAGDMKVDRQGVVSVNTPDVTKVPPNPPGARDLLKNIADQVQQSLQAATVPLAGASVKPGQSWTAQRNLPIDTAGRYDVAVMDLKYTYLGVRTRDGKQEAVVDIEGTIQARPNSGAMMTGKTNGRAIVDLAGGMITSVESTLDVDLDITVQGRRTKGGGTMELKLLRGTR